ncbi:MAG TPA: DUF1349 domain-containing protein [Lachnospiraceae bacterium]|nr:DUF1349 domain-containing protein [Lachnospiraceae bacterium]
MNFQLLNEPVSFSCNDDTITMEAGSGTNLFNDMCNDYRGDYFPFYYIVQKGDFTIRCKISPEFKALYDLGCIIVYDNQNKWIKFAYENSDSGHPAMVSVVTDEVSDDCNGEKIYQDGVWMQIIRKGNNFSLHYSEDKERWTLVRIFRLEMNEEIKLGISAQCPMGESCVVKFEGLEVLENKYSNIRGLE